MGEPHYAITGVVSDTPSPRRDIELWYKAAQDNETSDEALQVSLFLQALERFQGKPFAGTKADKLSYFRIASIHGLPLVPWDGVGREDLEEGQGYFCTHGMATFPTWHRPYLALYEQLIYQNMLELLNLTDSSAFAPRSKADWVKAAKSWRLPYWDYASNSTVPAIARSPNIQVIGFGNKKIIYDESHQNPMYSYRLESPATFGKLPDRLSLPDPWDKTSATSRQPKKNSTDFAKGISHSDLVSDAFQHKTWDGANGKSAGTIRETVHRLLNDSYFQDWSAFATTKFSPENVGQRAQDWLSLENFHNSIHGLVGGIGQMGKPSVAAFDPIFWVHHCFIDMLFNSWQIITDYKHWFDDPVYVTKRGVRESILRPSEYSTNPLLPFFNSKNQPYNSDMVVKTQNLHYTYDWVWNKAGRSEDVKVVPSTLRRMVNTQFSTTRSEVHEMLPGRKTDNDLIINVKYNRFAINNGESYWIHFFVGPPGEPEGYMTNHNRVGSVYNFSDPYTMTGCENCKDQVEAGVLATGQVPMTGAILKDWLDEDIADLPASGPFNEDAVEQYLQKHLTWSVVSTNGQLVAPEALPDLKVFVLMGDADHSLDDHVQSRYSNYRPLWAVTQGKPGGGTQADL